MPGTKDQRIHPRIPMTGSVKVEHPSFGTCVCTIGNISNGGMFIKSSDVEFPGVGSVMQVQALDLPVAAEVLDVKVVWKESNGVGVEFCL
jgi:hypothetical protein